MSLPRVSVIVPHLNQPAALAACLISLDAQVLDDLGFEILVVDNGSATSPLPIIQRHARVRLLQEAEPGPGLARNRGVQEAVGDVLAFIDADCRAHPDWLRNGLKALGEAPPNTVIGGDVRIWRPDPSRYTALEAYESVFAYRFKLYIEQRGFSGTGNLMVMRHDFTRVGPFRGIDVAEDLDWGARAIAAGCTFRYVPEMIVYHPARSSVRELCVKWDRHLLHAFNGGDRSPRWKALWLGKALALLASPLIEWVQIVRSDRVNGVIARAKAFGILTAVRSYRFWRMISLLRTKHSLSWNRSHTVVASSNVGTQPGDRG